MRKKHRTTRRRARHVPGQKPRGNFQERVKAVGPEHFAIVAVDCGKDQARARVADFYGRVLLAPFDIPITRAGLQNACALIQHTFQDHHIRDCVCVIETTGRYHRPVKDAFQKQGWDVRDVHPFTSSLLRRSCDLGNKTDDIDLAALHRAAVSGLAMQPETLDVASQQWRLLTRHRRDLVEKMATLKIQLKEAVHAYLPGYARLWESDNFWKSPIPMAVATAFDSPQAMQKASVEQFRHIAREADSVIQRPTIDRLLGWTYQAAPPDEGHRLYHRRACSLWKDLLAKQQEIREIELDLAQFLCHSPCVLLLAFPGVNVVAASDYGAELGPITNYAASKCIAGRAGLYPSRYQTSQTDLPNGPLVARRNRQLRAALMRMAHCLNCSNDYFHGLASAYQSRQHQRQEQGEPACSGKVVIARAFSRLSYYIIASGRLSPHPSLQHSEKILQKLLKFHQEHEAPPELTVKALDAAMARLSADTLCLERLTLEAENQKAQHARRCGGVRRLCEILPQVLLRIDQQLKEARSPSEAPPENTTDEHEDGTHGS